MSNDFLLIRKMKQGDDAAFDRFVRKYYREILSYCSYHCPDREYAEDLTQETFTRFFSKLSKYHDKGKTRNYLYTIAGNLCKDYFKKRKAVPVEEMELECQLEQRSGNEESVTEAVLDRLAVEWALGQLPDELREVVILYYFQELKVAEIAGTQDISLPLAKYRLRQAKIKLERLLKACR